MNYSSKLSLIGAEHVGKTSLIFRYINNTFTEEYQTTLGADFVDKEFNSDDLTELKKNDTFTLTIWDMAGQSHFHSICEIYIEGSMGIILVFDLSDPSSLEAIEEWKKIGLDICPNAEILVVGNKSDKVRKITDEQIRNFEESNGLKIEIASAKLGDNVSNVFAQMAKKLIKRYIK